jgi:hypothetical protein
VFSQTPSLPASKDYQLSCAAIYALLLYEISRVKSIILNICRSFIGNQQDLLNTNTPFWGIKDKKWTGDFCGLLALPDSAFSS